MEFVKEYSTIIIAILGAGGWLGFFVKLFFDNRKDKKATIEILQKELNAEREQNKELRSIEQKEKSIDKSSGSVYMQTVGDGITRAICGFCWEREHITIPIIVETYETYFGASCQNCQSFCQKTVDEVDEKENFELPF